MTEAPPGLNGTWGKDEQEAQALVSVWEQPGAAKVQIAELEGQLTKGSGGNPAYKAAVYAMRVALAGE